ncbi:MAG: glycosyltransferase, partial [Planctomycetota bacterium]|nr:glycosyltransferase [Planctomycetota bacterium]
MNILFVIDALWVGGTERSLADMLPYLERAGVTCAVVCLRARDEGVEAEVIARGTPVHFLGTSSLLSQVRALRQIIRKVRPNVVHSALFRADLVARLAMIGMPSALVNSIVNTTYDEARLKDPTLSRHRIRLVQAVDVVTGRLAVDRFHAVSEAARAAAIRYQRIPPGRIGVARRGRDAVRLGEPSTDRRRAARSALGLKEAAFVLISVGRQDPQKG